MIGSGACEVDGLELAQAINELKMGGLLSLDPAVRSIPKAEGLGCSRFFFPLIAIALLLTAQITASGAVGLNMSHMLACKASNGRFACPPQVIF